MRKLNGQLTWKQMGVIDRGCPWGFEKQNGEKLAEDLGIQFLENISTWTPVE